MNLSFGEKIKEARLLKGFTQKQLAIKIGAKHNSISDWENNKNKPDPDAIELLCGVLDITPNYLLSASPDEFSPTDKLLVKKYHDLDDHGKKTVDIILAREVIRTETIRNLSGQENGLTIKDMEKIWSKIPKNPEEFEKKYPPIDLDKNKETG